jgi:hypothetical protein
MEIKKSIKIPEALQDKIVEMSHDQDMKNNELMELMLKTKSSFERMRHAHNILWKMLSDVIRSEEMDPNDTWRLHVKWGRGGLEACEIQLTREDEKTGGEKATATPDNPEEWMKHFKKNVGLGDDSGPSMLGGFFGGGKEDE